MNHHEPPPLSDATLASVWEWVKTEASDVAESSKRAFAFLVGINTPPSENTPSQSQHPTSAAGVRHTSIGKSSPSDSSSAWSFAGLFSGMRGLKALSQENPAAKADWTEGEVHADLVKDPSGNFQYRYLLVDIPRE